MASPGRTLGIIEPVITTDVRAPARSGSRVHSSNPRSTPR
jgi:hypothetical protein